MKPFEFSSALRASLAIALKFAAYRAATCESEGRDLFCAALDGQRHPKLAALIHELDRELMQQEPKMSATKKPDWMFGLYKRVVERSTPAHTS